MTDNAVRIGAVVFALAATLTLAAVQPAAAGGTGSHEHKSTQVSDTNGSHGHHTHSVDWGAPGEPGRVNRSIEVVMGDIFFEPESIEANEGDTVRFVIRNTGKLVHEFNIGTHHMHQEHREEMARMMALGMMTATEINHQKMAHSDMQHDDANSVLLEPGQEAELIWHFAKAKQLQFACNVPGHYQAGMVGAISVEERVSRLTP